MDWEITDAAEWMLPQLEELERRCFSLPWTGEQLKGQLPDEHHVFLAALRGEQLLAYVGMMHVLDEGYISNVAATMFPVVFFRSEIQQDTILTHSITSGTSTTQIRKSL